MIKVYIIFKYKTETKKVWCINCVIPNVFKIIKINVLNNTDVRIWLTEILSVTVLSKIKKTATLETKLPQARN